MAPVPQEERLRLTIAEVDSAIFKERGRLAQLITSNTAASQRDLFGQFTRIYNLLTRRHVLELKRTYQNVRVWYQVEFLGVRDADGNWIERPAKMGRIADSALQGDFLQIIEVKTKNEIMRAVPKGMQKVFSDFLPSSRVAEGIVKERDLVKWGGEKGVAFWFRAQEPITLISDEFEVPVNDVRISRAQNYMNMGDGIESSRLFKSPAGSALKTAPNPSRAAPESGRILTKEPSSGTAAARAISKPETNNRGTDVKTEINAFNKPQHRLPNMPAEKGKTPTFDQLINPPNPSDWLKGNKSTQQHVEGTAMMIHNALLSRLYNRAMAEAEEAIESRNWQIKQLRENDKYVAVYVSFFEPEMIEIDLGAGKFEPDQYPIYASMEIRNISRVSADGTTLSPADAKARLDKQGPRAGEPGRHVPKYKPPAGRVIRQYDYAFYLPFPSRNEPYWLREIRENRPELLYELKQRSIGLPSGGYGNPLEFLKAIGQLTEENLKKLDPTSYYIIKPWLDRFGRCTVHKGI